MSLRLFREISTGAGIKRVGGELATSGRDRFFDETYLIGRLGQIWDVSCCFSSRCCDLEKDFLFAMELSSCSHFHE